MRLDRTADGSLVPGERFATFVDPGRDLERAITRLTGIRDEDLRGAPDVTSALAAFEAFAGDATLVGHNVGFDVGFLERAGLPPGRASLDTAELASIVWPEASSYGLQRLAADAHLDPGSAHRALDDALTCASLLGELSRAAAALRPELLEELRAASALLGAPVAAFFADALATALRGAWTERAADPATSRRGPPARRRDPAAAERLATAAIFAPDGILARAYEG